jgi:hypothetical protein
MGCALYIRCALSIEKYGKFLTIQFQKFLKTVRNCCVPELCENTYFSGRCRTVPQTVNRLPFIPEVQVRFQASPFRICMRENVTTTGIFPSTAVSPFSVISPAFHTHISFIYCQSYTMFSTESVVK